MLLLEERELTVARVSGTIKQVQRRGVFFLPTSSTVFSYLSVLFSFSFSFLFLSFSFSQFFSFFCSSAPLGKGVFITRRGNLCHPTLV